MDPLYDEEYDASGAHSLLTQDCDEESMDIYSGLGDTPTHTTETPSMLFSPRLKASMDLYEEILTEEVRSKDSSFEELKSRFLAAQSQIEELRSRLTQTETQNTGLSTENLRLKKNISALLKTARQEVLRKDQEIQRLNQSSGMKPYNPRGNGQWRNHPNPHTAAPPPAQPLPHPGPGTAPSPIAPTSRTAATPAAALPYPPPPQHRPSRTSSAGSSTSAPPAPQTTPLIPPSRALPPPQPRRTSLTHSSATPTAPPNPPAHQPRASRSSAAPRRPPAPPTETAPPSLLQQSKTTTCKPSPPPTNPPPPKHRPSRTSTTTSSLSSRPPAPPTESPLPSPSQTALGRKSSRISSTSTPSPPPTNPPPPPSLPLPKPIRTSSRISTSKEPSPPLPTVDPPPPPPTLAPPPPPPPTLDPPPPPPLPTLDPPPPPPPTLDPPPPPPPTLDPPPPPPPTLDPPPPPPTVDTSSPPPPTVDPTTPPPTVDSTPPPPPTVDPTPPPPSTVDPPPPPSPVLHPPPPSPLSEDVRPESLPPPPPPEKVSDRAAQRPDTTCLETSRSKRPANARPTRSSRLDLEAMDKPQGVDSQSASELPAELCEPDTPRPSKHKEQEPKSQTRSQPTEKRLKTGSEPGKDCETNHRSRSRRAEKESRTKHRSHRLLKSSRSQEAEERHRSESGGSPSSGSLDRRQDKPESNQSGAEPRESRLRDSVREHRKEKHGDRSGEKRARDGSRDRRNTAPKQHTSGAGESSKRKGDRADPSGDDRRKTERRREDENGRRERRSEKHKDSDRKRCEDEGRRKAELRGGEKSAAKDLEKASEEEEEITVPAGTPCLTENSPNRKLCFMETLNLTLSPVKKPLSQQADGEGEGEEEEEGEILSREDEDQPNLEEFLIIDEIESSMTEMEMDDKQCPKPSSAVQTSKEEKCATEDGKEDQRLTTTETRAVVDSEGPEVPPVASPSAGGGMDAGGPTLKRPAMAKESIVIPKPPAENMQCSSPNNPVVMENLETLNDGVEMVHVSEDSPSQNNRPGNLSEVIEPAEPMVLQSEPELQESPSTAPVDCKKLSSPCPLTSADEVKETVLLSPLTSPVADEVKETVSGPRPISSPVADVVKEVSSLPCPIKSPVSGDVNKGAARLSSIKSPVSEGVHETRSTPRPVKSPAPGEVTKAVSSPCPITRLAAGDVEGKVRPEGLQSPPNARPHPRAPASTSDGGAVERQGGSPKGSDAVSSTITLEALPHGDISLPEAIYALTHADSDDGGGGFSPGEPGSSAGCVGVSKVSSTTEDMALPGRRESVQGERTPVKGYGFCERRPPRRGAEPSSSGPLPYDEDSMMLTLRNLRSIPDVISPLRSPLPPARRPPPAQRSSTKPAHVKSLQRDFCSSAIVPFHSLQPNPKKAPKQPEDPAALEPVAVTSLSPLPGLSAGLSPSSSDLEEGEILSDSNEAPADTAPPQGSKPTRPANANANANGNKNANKPSPRSTTRTAKRSLSLKGAGGAPPPSTPSPSSGKSRFKKVCPGVEQAAFSSVGEVMDTLKKVRFQIRKKYMKLHKVFPKKSFYAMMDHFQQSFMEYVENAVFGEISAQVGELKARLRKLVTSVFGKVMNNGIVNRIFDQQATNLKRRLWEFVEVQLDYLFLDIQLALNTFCKPAETRPAAAAAEHLKVLNPKNGKIPKKSPVNTSPKKSRSPKERRPAQRLQRRIKPCPVVPTRTGLGRGKDIRITCMERRDPDTALPPRGTPLSPERGARTAALISHSSSTQDRSDYDILTEQQASSLTFNLVRDTQMGEIFKCLMQGSDLLDASVAGGDHTSWSLGTPRKEGAAGDGLLGLTSPSKFLSPCKFSSPGKFVTPTKFVTSPSRLMGAWSSLSPGRLCSPQPKLLRMPLHPAMFDESCLLELPSGGAAAAAQRSYSLLAEDLAVSLTLPSPLKSDSHLSFLQQPVRPLDLMSTPESVISAHFGEDALLDAGEDAWEQQDLHLALDTDNSDSSCCSSSSTASTPSTHAAAAAAAPASMLFQFKPHLPMQAVVMERSNDHFILKIRQSAVDDDAADVTLTPDDDAAAPPPTPDDASPPPTPDEATPTAGDDSLSRTLTEEAAAAETLPVPRALFLEKSFGKAPPRLLPKRQQAPPPEETARRADDLERVGAGPGDGGGGGELPSRPPDSASSADEMEVSTASEGRLAIVEDGSSGSTPGRRGGAARGGAGRKRRSHHQQQQQKTSAKRARKEKEEEGGRGRGRGRRSKPAAAVSPRLREPRGAKQRGGAESPPKTPPPSSGLSAKNLVKKKGEVVVAWTREEDRSILLDLKTKGASRETFSVLSEKLHKTSAQIAERFSQLMKLFKKQEKRTSP